MSETRRMRKLQPEQSVKPAKSSGSTLLEDIPEKTSSVTFTETEVVQDRSLNDAHQKIIVAARDGLAFSGIYFILIGIFLIILGYYTYLMGQQENITTGQVQECIKDETLRNIRRKKRCKEECNDVDNDENANDDAEVEDDQEETPKKRQKKRSTSSSNGNNNNNNNNNENQVNSYTCKVNYTALGQTCSSYIKSNKDISDTNKEVYYNINNPCTITSQYPSSFTGLAATSWTIGGLLIIFGIIELVSSYKTKPLLVDY